MAVTPLFLFKACSFPYHPTSQQTEKEGLCSKGTFSPTKETFYNKISKC